MGHARSRARVLRRACLQAATEPPRRDGSPGRMPASPEHRRAASQTRCSPRSCPRRDRNAPKQFQAPARAGLRRHRRSGRSRAVDRPLIPAWSGDRRRLAQKPPRQTLTPEPPEMVRKAMHPHQPGPPSPSGSRADGAPGRRHRRRVREDPWIARACSARTKPPTRRPAQDRASPAQRPRQAGSGLRPDPAASQAARPTAVRAQRRTRRRRRPSCARCRRGVGRPGCGKSLELASTSVRRPRPPRRASADAPATALPTPDPAPRTP